MKTKFIFTATVLLLGLRSVATTFYVDLNNPIPVPPYTNWSTASTDIQSAVDVASDGDLILVTNGVYASGGRVVYGTLTNRVVVDKAVRLQSINGPEKTIIQGYRVPSGSTAYTNDVRGLYMTNNVLLDGFMVTGGATLSTVPSGSTSFARTQLAGGDVFCESTNTILTNCILTGNLCASVYRSGGGGAIYQGTLNGCVLSNNNVNAYSVQGGAAYYSVLNNCLLISNSATSGGGAAFSILNHCQIVRNIAPDMRSTSWGGGTFVCTANHCLIADNFSATFGGGDCSGNLNYCILSNNTCGCSPPHGLGGGSYQAQTYGSYIPALNNCLVISNYSYGYGGGVDSPDTNSANCTVVGNTAAFAGGGVSNGKMKNSIVYGNNCVSNNFASNNISATFVNCWTSEPQFVNPSAGDYHLSSTSPCINAGNNAYVSSGSDLGGDPRIVGGTVDIGAYEYQTPVSVISYAWLQQYGLATDGSADFVDSDGTGMNNWQKWIAGLNPTNPASVLAMTTAIVSNSIPNVRVSWQSVNTRTYFFQRTSDLTQPFSSIHSNIVGQAGTTSYTDSTVTGGGSYFYRVGIQ